MKIATGLSILILACTMAVPNAAGNADAPAASERAREIAQNASQTLMKQLKSALLEALKSGGPVAAVAVCADTAQVLTARVARDLEVPGLQVKRTSLHLRNPANGPDSLETQVMEEYLAQLAYGETPAPRLESSGDQFRYFAPITTRGLCLQCHGPRDQFADGLPEILTERYPADRAVGHTVGDLRGIVSVTIPAAAIAPGF